MTSTPPVMLSPSMALTLASKPRMVPSFPMTTNRMAKDSPAAARDGGVIVGYGGIAIGPPPRPDAEIHNLAVAPDHQGRGIGRALLRALLAAADAVHARVFLEVRTDNAAALGLYASEGFAVVGLRRRYYQQSGADAHTMRRERR